MFDVVQFRVSCISIRSGKATLSSIGGGSMLLRSAPAHFGQVANLLAVKMYEKCNLLPPIN